MAKYKLLYLPVDKPLTDGCTAITISGEIVDYNELGNTDWKPGTLKVAEPFVVTVEFNQLTIVGRPTEEAMKWLKQGDDIAGGNAKLSEPAVYMRDGFRQVFITCPTCQHKY